MKQFFLFTFLMAYSMVTFAQSADEIIANHLKAIGGAENWKKVTSTYAEMSSDMGGVKIPIKMWGIHNKGMKVEFVVQGMTGIQVVTDKDGWSLMPFMGQTKAEPTPEDQLVSARAQLDIQGDLIDYAAKGSVVELLGEDTEEGVEVYKVKLTDKDKNETTYFVDKETSYIIKEVSKSMVQGQEVENAATFSNFKKVGDLVFPFATSGGMGNMVFEKIEINVPVDTAMFAMPK
jgi:hypothetical protein